MRLLYVVLGVHLTIEVNIYSENHSKPINTLFGKYAQFFNVKRDGTYTNLCTSKG
jgi:hypothetical protein